MTRASSEAVTSRRTEVVPAPRRELLRLDAETFVPVGGDVEEVLLSRGGLHEQEVAEVQKHWAFVVCLSVLASTRAS